MRRPGHYSESGGNAYIATQMQHMSGVRMEQKSDRYQGGQLPLTSQKEHAYGASKAEGQWRWERDGSKVPNAMSSHMFNEGQRGDASRSYYQGQRADQKMALVKQGNSDPRSQASEEDMEIGYEDSLLSPTFEGLEQKFLDDITKLSKEQTDAEDAENSRHRERIYAINAQYEEQLAALRARHTSRREEFLRRESHARQQQYQKQVSMDHFPNRGMGSRDSHRYDAVAIPTGEQPRAYSVDYNDSYRERARFLGAARDDGFEPRGEGPGGRIYDIGSRYY